MNFGFDIDGCMNNLHEVLDFVIQRDFGLPSSPHNYELTAKLNFSNIEQAKEFWDKYNPELHSLVKCETGVSNILNQIKDNIPLGQINIITGREYDVAKETIKWLNNNKINYDNIYFSTGDKLEVCKWKNVLLMVEDKPDLIKLLSENGILVLAYDRSYNKNISGENIIRVHNWTEILNEIKKYEVKLLYQNIKK